MPYGLYISAEGALAQSQRLETIANNLANVDTPAFKRDLAIFEARYAEATEQGDDQPGSGSVNDVGGGVLVRKTLTDFSGGPLKRTDIPTDMAIEGEGFFVVQKNGQTLLTRAGNFLFGPDGRLVTTDGYSVLSDAGTPIVIDPSEGEWQLTPDGAIAQGGDVTPLALVRPESLGDLMKVGENLFAPLAQTRPIDPTQRRVLGGTLEHSGVKATHEMMEMIEASRAFEANVNMIRHQDQALAGLVTRVLRA